MEKVLDAQLEQIRDQQKQTWDKFSPGWKKWDDLTMDFLRPMGNEIIRLLAPKGDELVLDVAAGTGEPGLTIAGMLPDGRVTITDLSEGMLDVAKENATAKRISNIETVIADACDLPFADNTFDAISCRFGFMFFPDMLLAAQEMLRVLKPGGKIAVTVWGAPEKNFWATATLSVINKNMNLPKPPPGAPGLYRCAERGLLAGLFHDAGFRNITEAEVNSTLNAGTVDVYWDFMTGVVAPVVAALGQADEPMREKIKAEVYEAVNAKYPTGALAIDANALVIYGVK